MRELTLLAVLVVVCAAFAVAVEGFADARNLMDRSRYWVEIGLIAVTMTFIIATGGIDLSVGSMLALSATVAGVLWRDAGWSIGWACSVGILAGALAGSLNGAMIRALSMPPLVVTLATMAAFRGLAIGMTQANPVRNLPETFQQFGQGTWLGVPMQLPLLLVVGGSGMVILGRSWLGSATLALGENPLAARFAALPTGLMTVGLYAASGLICGVGGVIFLSRYGYINPETAGVGLELEVIAAVVVGGTRITGGSASVAGTLLAVLLLDLLRFGLQLSGTIRSQQQMILVGILVVATAVLNEWWARRRISVG